MARSNIPLDFPVPDFARIREETGVVMEQAMRAMYFNAIDTRRRVQRIQQELGWQSAPFAAGNFTANSGTWTVASADQKLLQYIKVGQFVTINFFLEDTTTSSVSKGRSIRKAILPPGEPISCIAIGRIIVPGRPVLRIMLTSEE